jgi:hypothetical protein
MKSASEMTDREWRLAVENQRHVIEEFEEAEGRWKKGLADTRAELKGARKRLDRLLRGEDADEPSDPDQPGLFDATIQVMHETQRAAAGEKPDPDESEKPKRGRRGPKRIDSD